MSLESGLGVGTVGRFWPVGVLAAGVGAVALGLWQTAPPARMPTPAAMPAAMTAAPPAPTVGTAPAAADAAALHPAPAPGAPRFDLVRVEPGGKTLVAGQALPGRKVSVVVDGETVGAAEADATGQFVAFVSLAASARPRVMWLTSEDGDGAPAVSAETVIVAPDGTVPEGQVVASAALAAEPAAEPAAAQDDIPDPAVATAAAAPVEAGTAAVSEGLPAADGAPDAGADAAGPVPQAAAPRVLLSDASGIRPLDAPPLEGAAQIRLDSVDYGADDAVVLRGRSAPGATLRAYLDGSAKGDVQAAGSGLWEFVLPGIAPGLYRLRIDRVEADGRVAARVEVPFRRERPEVIRSALAGTARIVTVQPGATLWAIARDRYGEGLRYVSVFEANRSQIRNPDLIYPGQVFDLPDDPATGAALR